MTGRRFPPPWRADKMPGGYVVRDANGQALVYVNSRDNDAEALQARVFDQGRGVAANVARRANDWSGPITPGPPLRLFGS
jgi:hypothetical protein